MTKKRSAYEQSDSCSHFQDLIASIFEDAFPVWNQYHGGVPAEKLDELDEAGDWPRGTAAAVMNRLTRSAQLRKQLGKRCQ